MKTVSVLFIDAGQDGWHERLAHVKAHFNEVTPVSTLDQAAEAMSLQRFDGVLIGEGWPGLASVLERTKEIPVASFPCSPESFTRPQPISPAMADKTAPAAEAEFSANEFSEQCAGEWDLMVEVLELFEAECAEELPAMVDALSSGDFPALAKLAHTLKGSLGSLHAPVAWKRSGQLEQAAKEQNSKQSSDLLRQLQDDLVRLKPHLEAFLTSRGAA